MNEERSFEIFMERESDFVFRVGFDEAGMGSLLLDEPEPIGQGTGPNPSRILAAAVGNCLSASLLFCLQKAKIEARGVRTRVRGEVVRNERGRWRLGPLRVRIELDADEAPRLNRCLGLFEDYCVVSQSVREGIEMEVEVVTPGGERLAGTGSETPGGSRAR